MQPIEAVETAPRRASWRSLPRWRNWLAWYVAPAAVILALVVLWEIAVVVLRVPRVILPAPTAVLGQLTQNPGFLLMQAGNTALETLLGFLLSLLIGVPLAVAIVYSRFLKNTLYTVLVVLNSVPKVAVAPLFIIWMGTGLAPKVAIALSRSLLTAARDLREGRREVP
jgi:NitT/TauT family transport system permease protein